MSDRMLDRLLVTLDVAVEAFAILEVQRGTRLAIPGIDAIVVHYVLQGALHLEVGKADRVTCGPGSIVIVPPGLDQAVMADNAPVREVQATEHAALVQGGMLRFDAADGGAGDLRVMCGTIIANISGSFGLLDRLAVPLVEDVSAREIVRHAFDLMLEELAMPGFGGRALTGSLMKSCLVLSLREHFARPAATTSLFGALQDPRLGRAVSAVLDKPSADHNVAALAAAAGMSRSAFAREFRGKYGMAPMEFVAKTRLHHAAQILRSTTVPIKVIAGSIGFLSRSHFSRAFRDAYGVDPTRFRKETTRPELEAPRGLRGPRERFALAAEPVESGS